MNCTSDTVSRREDRPGFITLTVAGKPPGKPRQTRRDKWAKRPRVMRYRVWCDYLRLVAGRLPPAEEVGALNWTAYFRPPASWSKGRQIAVLGTLHRMKPDRDNIDKAVLDGLWPESERRGGDSGIARGTLEKLWGEVPRIVIEIELLPHLEPKRSEGCRTTTPTPA